MRKGTAILTDTALAIAGAALVAAVAQLVVGCGDDGPGALRTCAVPGLGEKPDSVDHIGCAADYDALGYEDDPFSTFARTNSMSVIVDRQDGNRVYFLDTEQWWLHFDFVFYVLEGHAAGDPGYSDAHLQFNLVNYQSANRRYLLGKVVQYVDQDLLVFNMAAGDRAGADLVVEAYDSIAARLYDGERLKWRPVSNDQEQLIAEVGDRVPIITSETLFAGQTYQPLNATVGYGTLRFLRASQLSAQPPLPTDIVVLDHVPADVSVVSGIITEEFQTPLSHINILAKGRGTPNMALRGAFDDATLRAHDGALVKLTVSPQAFTIEPTTLAEAQPFWDEHRPQDPLTPVHDDTVTGLVPLAGKGVEHITSIGGKASNFAEMARAFPTVRMPGPGFAVPFSAFEAHMTAHGLWTEVEAIIAERTAGTLDDLALQKRLFHLRKAIYDAPLDPALRDALHGSLLSTFGATKIRLRSSTNVEDLAGFSGAGLYTSLGVTPSDGAEEFERGLKVVWASSWNAAAFIEREYYRVDQRQLRMAVLIHPAFSDEQANGVALTQNDYSELRPGYFINAQQGEISVTNPSGQATPEQVLYYTWYETPEYEVLSRSSLTGGAPVLTDVQYGELATFLQRLRNHFNPLWCQLPTTPPSVDPNCAIDVEWKLAEDGLIYVKQARPLRSGP